MKRNIFLYINLRTIFIAIILFMYLFHFTSVPRVRYDEGWESIVSNNVLSTGTLSMPQLTTKMGLDHTYFLHPPLYNMTLAYWYKLVGVGLFQGRLLSFIFISLSLFLLFLVVSETRGKKYVQTYLWFLAINPMIFVLSRSIRPESMLVLIISLLIYVFHAKIRDNLKYAIIGALSGLALSTHIPGVLTFITINFYLANELIFVKISMRNISKLIIYNLFFAIGLSPYILYVYSHLTCFLEQAHAMYPKAVEIKSYLINPFIRNFLFHPYLLITTITLIFSVVLYLRHFDYSINKEKNIFFYFIFGYLFFISFYLTKSWCNFLIMAPIVIYFIVEVLYQLRSNTLKIVLLILYGFNIFVLCGLFFINYEFSSKDYEKFITSNLPQNAKVLCRQEDFFIVNKRNPYSLLDAKTMSGQTTDEFIANNKINYVIATEGLLKQLNIQLKHEKVAQILLKGYKVDDESNCYLYIIKIV